MVVYGGPADGVLRHRVLVTAKNNNQTLGARTTSSGKFIGNEDERVEWISRYIRQTIKGYQPLLTSIEGPSYSKHEQGQVGRYELQGVVKNYLLRNGFLFITPSPSEIKKWATGNGKAEKEEMIAAAAKEGFVTTSNDIADAFHLAQWAYEVGLGLLEPMYDE